MEQVSGGDAVQWPQRAVMESDAPEMRASLGIS
jgi:hypothetical protein